MKKIGANKIVYLLLSLLILVFILVEARGEGDFLIFQSAASDLLKSENIYRKEYSTWYHYYYDVVFALLLYPLSFLPLYYVKVLWLMLNVFFAYRIWQIILSWLPLSLITEKGKKQFVSLSVVFVFAFLWDNFHLSQVTIFLLYLTFEGLHLINTQRTLRGSILIAFGITMKVLPIFIIPYLIYRREWKSTFFVILFSGLLLLIPGFIIGFEFNSFLLQERWKLLNPTNVVHILDTNERSFHSLTTYFATLLVKDCQDVYALPLRRNIADISLVSLNLVITMSRLALILFAIYFLGSKPFKSVTSHLQRLYELSYICLITPLIFPHQQLYAFFYILPASAYLLFFLVATRAHHIMKMGLTVSMIIIYFLTNAHVILGQFNHYYNHFKILTYGVFVLIVVLALYKPKKLFDLVIRKKENMSTATESAET
ncbi:MAG: glycosyltransferase family 87 protein [bacterium]|nr:glycosyltransferase family 87 protein [bacterium]